MSRQLHLPHNFSLTFIDHDFRRGFRLGYCMKGKRILPVRLQTLLLTLVNTATCQIWGHEWLGHAYESIGQPSRCLHCLKLDPNPKCDFCQGRGYLLHMIQMPEGYTKPGSQGPCPKCKGK